MTDHFIDQLVGKEIKRQRIIKGMSQYDLAQKLGITFQQVQKYERGINRVVISRLYDLAKALSININDFLAKLQLDAATSGEYGNTAREDDSNFEYENDIDSKEVLMLVRAYISINSTKVRHSIYNLVKSLSNQQDENQTDSNPPIEDN